MAPDDEIDSPNQQSTDSTPVAPPVPPIVPPTLVEPLGVIQGKDDILLPCLVEPSDISHHNLGRIVGKRRQ